MEATPIRKCNLGEAQQGARLRFGVLAIAVGLVAATAALELGAPRAALWAVALPFFIGVGGVLMALYGS